MDENNGKSLRDKDKALQLKLLNYSTAASLALTAGLALPVNQAEAGYACISPEISPASHTEYLFDFDNDGDDEFWIAYTSGLAMGKHLGDGGDVGVAVILSSANIFEAALSNGYVINGTKNFYTLVTGVGKSMVTSGGNGPWSNAGTKYLGLKFTLSEGGTYYGWARITTNSFNGFPFTVNKYCYNTTADGSIPAGQSPTAVTLSDFDASTASPWKLSTLGVALMTSIAGLWVWARQRLLSRVKN